MELIINGHEIRLPEVIFISGLMTSGKRTQCRNIAKMYNFDIFQIQDILIDEI
jgi:nucleoside-triphosphatase THEP1